MDRRRRLLNSREATTRKILETSAGRNSAEVWSKVRVADVLNLDSSGLSSNLFGYGLRAHFDFVVVDADHMPLFAVEFDGPLHNEPSSASNDQKKNAICDAMQFPLARVRDEHIFRQARGIDYVTWLTEVYFAFQALIDAQEAGHIPADEILDPMLMMSVPNLPARFPLWLSAIARVRLQSKQRAGRLWHPVPFSLTGEDALGTSSCMAILVRGDGTLFATTGSIYMRRFGVAGREAAEEIAVVNLERLEEDASQTITPSALRADVLAFLRRNPSVSCHGSVRRTV
jgi:hypothetical protein